MPKKPAPQKKAAVNSKRKVIKGIHLEPVEAGLLAAEVHYQAVPDTPESVPPVLIERVVCRSPESVMQHIGRAVKEWFNNPQD